MKRFRPPQTLALRQTPLIIGAEKFARRVHRYDKRIISGNPYIVHPLAVARRLQRLRFSEVNIATALLHDCVEDHPLTCSFAEIEDYLLACGARRDQVKKTVAQARAVTFDDDCSTKDEKYERYIDTLGACPDAIPVALADIADNTADIIMNLRLGIPVFGANFLNSNPREDIRDWLSVAALCFARRTRDQRINLIFNEIILNAELIKILLPRRNP